MLNLEIIWMLTHVVVLVLTCLKALNRTASCHLRRVYKQQTPVTNKLPTEVAHCSWLKEAILELNSLLLFFFSFLGQREGKKMEGQHGILKYCCRHLSTSFGWDLFVIVWDSKRKKKSLPERWNSLYQVKISRFIQFNWKKSERENLFSFSWRTLLVVAVTFASLKLM